MQKIKNKNYKQINKELGKKRDLQKEKQDSH